MDRHFLHGILRGLSDGVVLLDGDGTIAWVNEAALKAHGVADARLLGRSADEYAERFGMRYLNRHRVQAGQYPLHRALAGEEITDLVVEVWPLADPDTTWFHQIRSITSPEEQDSERCAVVIHDATARYKAEERFEAAFSANPAPALICRLSDRCFVKVNQGFVEMTGLSREQVIGRSLQEIDVLRAAERRDLALSRLSEGLTIPQMEARLDAPAGERAVIVAGQPIELAAEACMLFTFADLSPRTRVEAALRHSEERFHKTFELSPAPQAVLTHDLKFVSVNRAFTATFGWGQTDVVGRSLTDLGLWAKPGDGRRFQSLVKKGSVRQFECCIAPRGGEPIDCLIAAEPAVINDRAHLLCLIQDISGQKRSERELSAAIDAAVADTSWLTRAILQKLSTIQDRSRTGGETAEPIAMPSERERQVLVLICQGLDDAQIGVRLSLARNTVRNHITALYRRLGVHSRSEAILWAHQNGLVSAAPTGTSETKPER